MPTDSVLCVAVCKAVVFEQVLLGGHDNFRQIEKIRLLQGHTGIPIHTATLPCGQIRVESPRLFIKMTVLLSWIFSIGSSSLSD